MVIDVRPHALLISERPVPVMQDSSGCLTKVSFNINLETSLEEEPTACSPPHPASVSQAPPLPQRLNKDSEPQDTWFLFPVPPVTSDEKIKNLKHPRLSIIFLHEFNLLTFPFSSIKGAK